MSAVKFSGATEADAVAAANTGLGPFVGKTIASIEPAAVELTGAEDFTVCGITVTFTDGSILGPWSVDDSGNPSEMTFDTTVAAQ